MKTTITFIIFLTFMLLPSCNNQENLTYDQPDKKVLFLHHSTGYNVWRGSKLDQRYVLNKQNYDVPRLLAEYNKKEGKKISIERRYFPSGDPYPWNNYPYDYYNIWVKNAGNQPYNEEPTLELLCPEYDLISFKFCFPVSNMQEDSIADIDSDKKTLQNYRLQMNAVKEKLHNFPDNQFIVWTGAAQVEAHVSEEEALRAKEFFSWFKEEWDEEGDNIFVFDFREMETQGGLYLKEEYATSLTNPHPNRELSEKAAKAFVNKITETLK